MTSEFATSYNKLTWQKILTTIPSSTYPVKTSHLTLPQTKLSRVLETSNRHCKSLLPRTSNTDSTTYPLT